MSLLTIQLLNILVKGAQIISAQSLTNTVGIEEMPAELWLSQLLIILRTSS
jgi:hypothetical protein